MEFPEGWEVLEKNPFHGGGKDIFWNYTNYAHKAGKPCNPAMGATQSSRLLLHSGKEDQGEGEGKMKTEIMHSSMTA